MKLGVVICHKNIQDYPIEWVYQSLMSLNTQTVSGYTIHQLNYGMIPHDIFGTLFKAPEARFYNVVLPSHTEALNHVFEIAFKECDVIAVISLFDHYAPKYLELLLESIENGADIATSNYVTFNDNGIVRVTDFEDMDLEHEFDRGNVIIPNSCFMIRKEVFQQVKFSPVLAPLEYMEFWRACLKSGFKIDIRQEKLLYKREYNTQ